MQLCSRVHCHHARLTFLLSRALSFRVAQVLSALVLTRGEYPISIVSH